MVLTLEGNDMSATLGLLRFIGSPFVPETLLMGMDKLSELHWLSVKNRMQFFYLEMLSKKGNLGDLKTLYVQERNKCSRDFEVMCEVSKILTDSDIQHAVFKTVRPYTFTTVDIDIIVFGGKFHFLKAAKSLQTAGYELITCGPRSCTLRDTKANLGIDLYQEIATSFVTYMDKRKLTNFITVSKLENGGCIKTIKPEADLASIIAHSIIKEQMYTLSEYYTFVHYVKQLDVQSFLQIVKQNNLTTATKTHASLTALLHKAAHKSVPDKLQQILDRLGEEKLEMASIIQNNFKTPHKYHILTVARVLLEITKGERTRESIATQILHMTNLDFAKKFLRDLMKHVTRETY